MFGFFKNLWRKSPEQAFEYQEPEAGSFEATEDSGSEYVAPVAPSQPRRNQVYHNGGRTIDVPLEKILSSLPLELQPRLRSDAVDGMTMSIPIEKVLAQLSKGSVKISFGELRLAAPDLFTSANDRDRIMIALPLGEILSRLNPALIQRRRTQRTVEVPDDVRSPFDLNGLGLVFAVGPTKPEAAVSARHAEPPAPARHLSTPAASPPPVPGLASPHAPNRVSLTSAPKPAVPSALPPSDMHTSAPPAPIAFTSPKARAPIAPKAPVTPISPIAPAAPAGPSPIRPASPAGNGKIHFPAAVGTHSGAVAHGDALAAQPPVIAAPATGAPSPLLVPLTALAEGWSDVIRKEIIEQNLVDVKVALPADSIEQALRQGRIAFSWKTLRSWIKPPAPVYASPQDGAVLELPLKVVAPLFLARQREQTRSQQKVEIDVEIPNLFFGFPQTESAKPTAVAKPADSNFYVWDDGAEMLRVDGSEDKRSSPGTQFITKYATPNEVVSRASALDGITGALIALPDGLMVASQLPPEVNGETLAAFLPQIFGKVSQCTKELRMGELNNLNFTVGNVPWKIFRVNAIFFAAFGRAGEPLPSSQLAALAAELDHKPK